LTVSAGVRCRLEPSWRRGITSLVD